MCGIAGVVMRDGSAPDPRVLARLQAAIAHRGPDGQGILVRGDTALIHARLSIIDLATGDQPLVTPSGTALVANGEIYNDPDLRGAMAATPFRTRSDCELRGRACGRPQISIARGAFETAASGCVILAAKMSFLRSRFAYGVVLTLLAACGARSAVDDGVYSSEAGGVGVQHVLHAGQEHQVHADQEGEPVRHLGRHQP